MYYFVEISNNWVGKEIDNIDNHIVDIHNYAKEGTAVLIVDELEDMLDYANYELVESYHEVPQLRRKGACNKLASI